MKIKMFKITTQIKFHLYLKFPDLVMEKDQTEDVLVKDLTNTASVVGVPAEHDGEGEPDVTAEWSGAHEKRTKTRCA